MSAPEPASPLVAVLVPGRHGAEGGSPVRIGWRRCQLVQVAALPGFDLPGPARSATADGITALWLQPHAWLLQAAWAEEGALARRAAAAGGAAVVDQSHGRCVLSLEGERARDVLARLCHLDLHPRVFAARTVAVTPLDGIPGVLHRTGDAPGYDLIIPASYAEDFARRLLRAAEEVGCEVTGKGC